MEIVVNSPCEISSRISANGVGARADRGKHMPIVAVAKHKLMNSFPVSSITYLMIAQQDSWYSDTRAIWLPMITMYKCIPTGLGMLSSMPAGIAILRCFVNSKEWISNEKVIAKSRKSYSHFDEPTNLSKCGKYVLDPNSIKKHGFYPFIHYEMKQVKYKKGVGRKTKKRDICYASHIDSCIYQYYCFLLNNLYNERVKSDGTDSCAVAYRTDLGLTNIDIAKRAFDFVKKNTPCYVIIGDFTGFFDNLDHSYLKEQIKNLLGVKSLPEDYYAVFKSVTQYELFERTDLLKLNGLPDSTKGIHELNKKRRVLSKEEYKNSRNYIHKNENEFGIPQGSPISAVLANIYMLSVDKEINEYVAIRGGLYMRYSDDFIIVLPSVEESKSIKMITDIISVFNATPGVTLQKEKTQVYKYFQENLVNCGMEVLPGCDCDHRFLSFLGFTFDGKKVSIRSKTISKYYYRMRRKAKTIRKNDRMKKHVYRNLYTKYSKRGDNKNNKNFLTYVRRATTTFGDHEAINRDTRNHMQKIKRAIRTK